MNKEDYNITDSSDSESIIAKPSMTIKDERLNAIQRQVSLATVLIPLIGFIAAVAWLWHTQKIGILEISLVLLMYSLTAVGVTVGYHRHFAHRAFQAKPIVRAILAILGSMAVQGPLVYWVSNHRRHHQFSDHEGDPHSPHLAGDAFFSPVKGLWHAHIGWLFKLEMTNATVFSRDLLQDPLVAKVNRNYLVWVALSFAIPAFLGGIITMSWLGALNGVLWGGFVRVFLSQHMIFSINSITHMYGQCDYPTNDHSKNNLLVALFTAGEGWHNNHHAFPNSAIFGLKWWQIDAGGWVVRLLKLTGLAWDINEPTSKLIAARSLKS